MVTTVYDQLTANDSDTVQIISLPFSTVNALTLILLILVAVVGNATVMTVIAISKPLQTATSCFVINLAVTDLCIAIYIMPISVTAVMNQRTWAHGETACQVTGFLYVLFRLASIVTITLIGMDRCLAIRIPLKYKSTVTKPCASGTVLLTWVYALILAFLPYTGVGNYEFSPGKGNCTPQYQGHLLYTVVVLGSGICISLVVTLHGYALIGCTAMNQAKRGTVVCDENHCQYVCSKKDQLKALKTLCIVTGVFFSCWLPYTVFNFYSLSLSQQPEAYTDAITEWLTLLNSAINPWLYSLLDRSFRKAARRHWKKLKCRFCIDKTAQPKQRVGNVTVQSEASAMALPSVMHQLAQSVHKDKPPLPGQSDIATPVK